ncbi:MAG: hypothetical protein [Caudoviricetes sp.]|nr:MAG: hypothetical protein [Caudoviricetes sp.]
MNLQSVGNNPYTGAYGFNTYAGERAIGYTNLSSNIYPIFSQSFVAYYYPTTLTGRITSRSIVPPDLENGGNIAIFRRPPRAKVKEYTRNGIMEHDDNLGGSTIDIRIDQQYYYSCKIDDIDYKQIQNVEEYLDNYQYDAMQKLAQITDVQVIDTIIHGASAYNKGEVAGQTTHQWNLGAYGRPITLTEDNVFAMLTKMDSVLSEANIPANDRFIVVPIELFYALNMSKITLSALNSGLARSTAFNGLQTYNIPIASFSDVYSTNIMPKVYDSLARKYCSYVIGGRGDATAFVAQMSKSRVITEEVNSFDRYLQGLFVFGSGVIQPEALTVMYYTYAPKNSVV